MHKIVAKLWLLCYFVLCNSFLRTKQALKQYIPHQKESSRLFYSQNPPKTYMQVKKSPSAFSLSTFFNSIPHRRKWNVVERWRKRERKSNKVKQVSIDSFAIIDLIKHIRGPPAKRVDWNQKTRMQEAFLCENCCILSKFILLKENFLGPVIPPGLSAEWGLQ